MGFFETDETDTQSELVDNSLWVEKYRPNSLDTYIGNEYLKERITNYLSENDIPHLLFYGRAGTGKTTLAKLIANNMECDYMIINASDENNVETVRNKIRGFASTVGFKDSKVMILDEADYLTPSAQSILRNLMETFSKHCRFILTCNYVEKVIDPIQSRCQTFEVVPPSKKEIAIHVSQILQNEGIEFDVKDIVPIIDSSYPDIRRIINTCQMSSSKGKLKVDKKEILDSDFRLKVVEVLKSDNLPRNKYKEIRQIVANSRAQDFTEAYSILYQKVDEYAPKDTSSAILTISEGQYKDSMVIDKEIQFMYTIIKLLEVI